VLAVAVVKHVLMGPTCSETIDYFVLKLAPPDVLFADLLCAPVLFLLQEHYRLHFWQDPHNAVFY
jgi:hypothetical protein